MSPAEASTKGLAAELAATGQAQGARVLCPVPHVAGESFVMQLAQVHVHVHACACACVTVR